MDRLAGRPPRAGVGLRDRQRAGGYRPGRRLRARGSHRREQRATSPRDAASPHHLSPCTGRCERPRGGKRRRGQRGAGAPLAAARSLLFGGQARAGAGRRVRRVGLSPARHWRAVGRSGHAALPRSRRRAVLAARAAARREPAADASLPLHRDRRADDVRSPHADVAGHLRGFPPDAVGHRALSRGCRRGPGAKLRGSRRGRLGRPRHHPRRRLADFRQGGTTSYAGPSFCSAFAVWPS